MKVKNLLIGLTGLFGLLTIVYSGMNLYTLNTTNHYVKEAIEKGKTYQKINDDTRLAQVEFQRQVQEWKNILIRGNDAELYTKYLKQFRDKENSVNQKLNTLSKQLKEMHHIKESNEMVDLMKQHLDLGVQYNAALSEYNKEDLLSYLKVDLRVRGIDRPTSQAMDDISKDILTLTESSFVKIDNEVQQNYQEKVMTLLLIALVGILTLIIVGVSITRKIFKYLGNEPEELNIYFAKLANGNLKVSLDINGKDKSSISYNAKLMQFKLKNLISAVRNSSTEVEEAIQKISTSKSAEERSEGIVEAKELTKVLRKLTDRFEV